MNNAVKLWRKLSVDFRPSISREIGRKNITQIPPHIRTSNSTPLNQNYLTAILWELVGPNIAETCVLCHVNRVPWEVPGNCSFRLFGAKQIFFPKILLQCSQELALKFQERFLFFFFFLMCPGIQARRWIGLVSRENSSLRSWMSMGFESPQQRFATDDGHSRWWKIRKQLYPNKSETRKPCQCIGTLANASVTRWEYGVERLKEIEAANLEFIICFFWCVFSLSLQKTLRINLQWVFWVRSMIFFLGL